MLRGEVELAGDRRVKVIDVHPYTPAGSRADAWAEELSALPTTGRGVPWLLVGDFNATLDHAELRDVLSRGYRDAGDVTGSGLIPTWPNDRAYPPLITIDHVLADSRIGISGYGVEDLPGTDHRAIYARMFLPRSG
jgi:endonuclease/exonuclease/phosphatase family metal-dependent hydrolase